MTRKDEDDEDESWGNWTPKGLVEAKDAKKEDESWGNWTAKGLVEAEEAKKEEEEKTVKPEGKDEEEEEDEAWGDWTKHGLTKKPEAHAPRKGCKVICFSGAWDLQSRHGGP